MGLRVGEPEGEVLKTTASGDGRVRGARGAISGVPEATAQRGSVVVIGQRGEILRTMAAASDAPASSGGAGPRCPCAVDYRTGRMPCEDGVDCPT